MDRRVTGALDPDSHHMTDRTRRSRFGGDRSRRLPLALVLGLLAAACAPGTSSAHAPPTRSKPGPVTVRGVARHLHHGGFTLATIHHGQYQVVVASATRVIEKGKHGRLTVQDGDHVGVKGFLQGRTLRAIQIRIYPTKPKPYTVTGLVVQIQGDLLSLTVSGKTLQIRVTAKTDLRIGSRLDSIRQVRPGDRVRARVEQTGQGLVALSIHVYARRVSGRHVVLHGTIATVSSSSIGVRSSATLYQIAVTGRTAIYRGRTRVNATALAVGQTVTVHVCCAGGSLTATSIHIRVTAVPRRVITLRGNVLSISAQTIRLSTSRGVVTVALTPSTVYQVGATRADRGSVRVGDDVSVRAYTRAGALVALRVHVYLAGRRMHTVSGVVSAVTAHGLTITARGKRYLVVIPSSATVIRAGKRAPVSAIRVGDHIRARGRLQGTTLTVAQITVRPGVVRQKVVRGTVTDVRGAHFVIVDSFGVRHPVQLAPGTRPTIRGKPAPSFALFDGVHATAHGALSGNTLIATRVVLSVVARRAAGRVTHVAGRTLSLRLSSGTSVRVDVPAAVSVTDGRRKEAPIALAPGVYVRASGYEEPSHGILAVAVSVTHPTLDLTGSIVSTSNGIEMQTAGGDRFRLRFPAGSQILISRTHISLSPSELTVGAHLRVRGTVGSDGALAVSFASVRLTHASVRATVRSISGDALVVQNGTQAMTVRVTAETVIAQGSHTIGLQDLVVGDDVTADGYQLGTDTLLGRKVLVHRKLVGVDGMISSLTADGFSLATASGDIRVIVGTATVVVGSPAAGATVHVTGYRRGDGSILATRVRVTAALRAATVFPLYAGHSDARRNAAQTRRSSP